MGVLIVVGAHMGARAELGQALAMVTTEPARILRLEGHGLALGNRADLVVWDAVGVDDAVGALAPRVYVIKSGRVTVEHRPTVAEPWRGLDRPAHRSLS